MVRRGTQQELGAATFVRPSNSSSFTSHNFRIAKTLPVKNYQNTSPTIRHTLGRQTASDNLSPRSAPACREKMCRFHGKRNIFYAPLLLLQLLVSALHNPFFKLSEGSEKKSTRRTPAALRKGMSNLFVLQRCHRNDPRMTLSREARSASARMCASAAPLSHSL